jgi:hypothetical protein
MGISNMHKIIKSVSIDEEGGEVVEFLVINRMTKKVVAKFGTSQEAVFFVTSLRQ